MTPRDDTLPKLTIGMLAGTVAVGAAAQALRHRRVLRGQGDELKHTTSNGNVLAYRRVEPTRPASPDSPVLVCETGMMSSTEHWTHLRQNLGHDHTLLMYNRAGYGPSEYHNDDPYTLLSSVTDLHDLVRAVCPDRTIVLVGHSLGGYLALRALEPLRDVVVGVVLLDPSHPDQLHRSPAQAEGAKHLSFSLTLVPTSLRLGAGALLQTPDWLEWLPQGVRRLSLDQYRDWSMWKAGAREWAAAHTAFLEYDGELPKIGVPVRLIAAAVTHEKDPIHAQLHQELLAAAPSGDMHLIEDINHDELVMSEKPTAEVANLVRDFVSQLATPLTTEVS